MNSIKMNTRFRPARAVNEAERSRIPLNIHIRTEGVLLDTRLREAICAKIGRVRRYAPEALGARVQLVRTGVNRAAERYRAHVIYAVKGNDVSAQQRAHDPIAALDLLADKIERRLRKRKTAALARRVRGHRKNRIEKTQS